MRSMENIEYAYVLAEIKGLVGNSFEKMSEIEKGKLQMKIGKERITIELGKRMNISHYINEGDSDHPFIQKLRKELKGARLTKIEQKEKDRVIVFYFEREEEKLLIFEMFGEGNSILVSQGKTLACYKNESWSDREVKAGIEYKFPKSNIVEKLKDAISEKYIISAMLRLPLGKKYAKEILSKVGIEEKKPGNELSKKEIGEIEQEIEKIKKEFSPIGFYSKEGIVDYGLISFKEYEFKEFEKKEFESLSKAVDEFYHSNVEKVGKSKKLEKLEKRLEDQLKTLEEIKIKEEEYKKLGDRIYEKYSEIEEIIKKGKREEIEV